MRRTATQLVRWLSAPARPWSSWAVDGATLGYALWTMCCHAVMLSGGSTHALVWTVTAVATAGALALALVGYRAFRRRRSAPAATAVENRADPPAVVEPAADIESDATDRLTYIALGVAALCLLSLWLLEGEYLPKWIALCAYLAFALVLGLRKTPSAVPAATTARWQQLTVWAVAFASAWLSLYVQRWRGDDCFYINIAVTTADLPHIPLLSANTIHAPMADGTLQPVYTPYRVHSFEALGGYLSLLSGVPAIEIVHLWLGALGSLLIPLGLARLFAAIDGRRWLPMVFAAMCIYVFEGSSGLGYGDHGIVRSFTGKSLMLSVAVPVLVHNGIAFGRTPTWRRWLLLLAAQICAVGLSSTALWLAPVAAMLAVMVPLGLERRALRPFLAALLSCAYVLGLALWVRSALMPGAAALAVDADDNDAAGAAAEASANFGLLYWWLKKLFATESVANHYLSVMVVAIAVCRTRTLRRYLVLFCAMLAFALMNPYLGDFVRYNITGKWTGERVLFLLPMPAAVAGMFASVLPSRRGALPRALGLVIMAAAVGWFFTTVPLKTVLAASIDTNLRWPPEPKVPDDAYQVDQHLAALPLQGQQVLAPEVVSWFLPTVHHHPYPVLANAKYLVASKSEKRKRKRLVSIVTEAQAELSGRDQRMFAHGLEDYHVGAVVLTRGARHNHDVTDVLKALGFRRNARFPKYELWARPKP